MNRPLSHILIIAFCALIAVPAGIVRAAVTTTDEVTSYFRVMWGLLIVLAIILLLFALLKKRFSIINPRSTKAIRVLEIQPLMPRKSICLIEVRGKEYLLGVANESISLLADLNSDCNSKPSFQEVLEQSEHRQAP